MTVPVEESLAEIVALLRRQGDEIAGLCALLRPAVFGSVLGVEDVCTLLGYKRNQVFALLRAGELERAPWHGRATRIHRAGVDRLLAAPAAPKKRRRRRVGPFEPARLEDIPVFEW
jgi:hypothetical protein